MDATAIASVIVAVIAAGAALASQRSASNAIKDKSSGHNRIEMEKEAYERARAFDTETINRQNKQITTLTIENKSLRQRVEELFKRVRHLEGLLPPEPIEDYNDDK